MAINGINSYGMGYYNYQASINNMRLTQALANNSRLTRSAFSSASSGNNSLKSSVNFIKDYSSSMSDLMSAANELRTANSKGVMTDMKVTSSDTSVATATEKLTVKSPKDYMIDVSQIAQAQTNVSGSVKGSDKAESSMDFVVNAGASSVNVRVSALHEDGTSKTNIQMLREAASQINDSSANVRANVVTQKDGTATLELTGKYTGKHNTFNVSGELGAAKGLENVQTEAANAKYSVTENGKKTDYESGTNDISLDHTRIGVTLKGTGTVSIKADVDAEKTASALGSLVDAYNSSLKLLNDNYDRGSGVDRQLRSLVQGLGSEQSLEKLGITVNKDATLKFDKDVFAKNMKENPSLTKDLIAGAAGIADKAFNKASSGLRVNSGSLINGDLSDMQSESFTNPYNVFSMYSRSGVYSLNNYAAVGMMFNLLA